MKLNFLFVARIKQTQSNFNVKTHKCQKCGRMYEEYTLDDFGLCQDC